MPAAMEGVFLVCLSAADIIMAGMLGTSAVAAVSIFTQPRMMILCAARSLAAALTLLTAQAYGAGDYAECSKLLRQTTAASVVLFAGLHLLFFWHLEDILIWMGAEESYLSLAMEYGELALLGVFFTSLTAIWQSSLLGFGRTRDVMLVNVQGNVLNVIGNAVFIFGFGKIPAFGVKGAAIGTVWGTLWPLGATLFLLYRQNGLKDWFVGSFWPDRSYFRRFLPTFMSIFSEQGFERLGMVLYTRMVAELGVLPYAVHAVCMNFCDFYYSFAGGLGKASMILAGHAHGAGDRKQWHSCLISSLRWSFLFSLLSFAGTLAARDVIMDCYLEAEEARLIGSMILILVAAVSFPEAQAMVCAGILRGSGEAKSVAVYSFISIAVLRPVITGIFLYWQEWGLTGAWLALAIDQSLRALCATMLVYRLRENTGTNYEYVDKSLKI